MKRTSERRTIGIVLLVAGLALSACSHKGGRGTNDASVVGDAEDIGGVFTDIRSDADEPDAGDTSDAADTDAADTDAADTDAADTADIEPVDVDAPDADAADVDAADASDIESDAEVDELDAVDVADAPDTEDAADTTDADADDAPDTPDTPDTADTADTADTTDADVEPGPDTEIIKLVDPNAAPLAWFSGGSFGRAVSVDGDWMVLGADEDSAAGLSAGMVLMGTRTAGAEWVFERFVPNEITESDRFGSCAAVSGNFAVVGARGDSGSAFKAGAAYVLQRDGLRWDVVARLEPPEPRSEGAFGQRCAIDGDRIAVASWGEGVDSGIVYLFERDGDTWPYVREFVSPAAVTTDRFGAAVALGESHLLVGDDVNRSVVIIDLRTDLAPVILTEPGEVQPAGFGVDVAVSGDRFVVGSQQALVDGVRSGRVYVYRGLSAPTLEAELFDTARAAGDRFGASVDIDADTIVTGAYRAEATAARSGIAYRYVFDGTNWNLEETLLPSLAPGDRFGFEAAVSGSTIAVSAIQDDTVAPEAGAVYLYERSDSAPPPSRVFSGNTAADDRFGTAVATDGRFVFVGSPFDQDAGVLSGAVHWFELVDARAIYRGIIPHAEPTAGQGFGSALAVADGVLVVGATLDDRDGVDAGAVYAFRYDEVTARWSPAGVLRVPSAVPGGLFGERLAFDGQLLLVGSPTREDDIGSGATWLYRLNDEGVWVLTSRLDAVDLGLRVPADAPARVGAGLAISASSLFVGAPDAAPGGQVASLMYVSGGPTPVALVPTAGPTASSQFGAAVASNGAEVIVAAPGEGALYALSPGDATWFAESVADSPEEVSAEFGATLAFVSTSTLAVGAPNADATGDTDELQASAGRVWVFEAGLTRWDTSPRVYEAPDASIGALFGASLSAASGLFVAGAPGDDERGADAGAAYIVIAP